ncbi:hypothetical protein WOLCODRAFT_157360 [Wolfiporia cocos MD-104 SS10]|uniref:Uncharacterized protein n=1 Tax=Wolfiporia cocos (strain MD-104) TaxID=742152 RepID=A0A2H3J3B3_WOLCO|nr:hypothetical protein WOLCODRAFT_157360 [Wolfiporia cocos MD-104 SS10]
MRVHFQHAPSSKVATAPASPYCLCAPPECAPLLECPRSSSATPHTLLTHSLASAPVPPCFQALQALHIDCRHSRHCFHNSLLPSTGMHHSIWLSQLPTARHQYAAPAHLNLIAVWLGDSCVSAHTKPEALPPRRKPYHLAGPSAFQPWGTSPECMRTLRSLVGVLIDSGGPPLRSLNAGSLTLHPAPTPHAGTLHLLHPAPPHYAS